MSVGPLIVIDIGGSYAKTTTTLFSFKLQPLQILI